MKTSSKKDKFLKLEEELEKVIKTIKPKGGPAKEVPEFASKYSLNEVAEDMSNILKDLKTEFDIIGTKNKINSASFVNKQLENAYLKNAVKKKVDNSLPAQDSKIRSRSSEISSKKNPTNQTRSKSKGASAIKENASKPLEEFLDLIQLEILHESKDNDEAILPYLPPASSTSSKMTPQIKSKVSDSSKKSSNLVFPKKVSQNSSEISRKSDVVKAKQNVPAPKANSDPKANRDPSFKLAPSPFPALPKIASTASDKPQTIPKKNLIEKPPIKPPGPKPPLKASVESTNMISFREQVHKKMKVLKQNDEIKSNTSKMSNQEPFPCKASQSNKKASKMLPKIQSNLKATNKMVVPVAPPKKVTSQAAPKPKLVEQSQNTVLNSADLDKLIQEVPKEELKTPQSKSTARTSTNLIKIKKLVANVTSKDQTTPTQSEPSPIITKQIILPKKPSQIKAKPSTSKRLPETASIRSTTKPLALKRAKVTPQPSLVKHIELHPERSFIETDPMKPFRDEVNLAIKLKKTFTIQGRFQAVRNALVKRGWVEKVYLSYRTGMNEKIRQYLRFSLGELVDLMRDRDTCEIAKRLIKSKLLTGHQVDLFWGVNFDSFKENPDRVKLTLINKFQREIFSYTSKQGLCDALSYTQWYQIPGVAKINHPRTYALRKNGDTKEFVRDFHLTAAMSLLKWMIGKTADKECRILSASGKTPVSAFEFAVNECYKFIKKARHEDIDVEVEEAAEFEWNEFLESFYKTVHVGGHFRKTANQDNENAMVAQALHILNRIRKFWSHLEMDGVMNLWILKPTNSSRGEGIHVCRSLKYILNVIKENPKRRYIIQKYIERPLLIYQTKFDIRQWFLISSAMPLTIWFYKDCYLRFSSQTYNLRKLHESIHLTNNSVQSKYVRTNQHRDLVLPSYNMWDSQQFKSYLSNIGFPKAFDDIISPGMKQCITAAILMHQEKMNQRPNCFELYGADFMLIENFTPWLLEINSNPALFSSTPVTTRMCPKVQEDVIKVVVDFARNAKADTGGFELIYRQKLSKMPNNVSAEFQLNGVALSEDYFNNEQEYWNYDIQTQSTASTIVGTANPEIEEARKHLTNVTDGIRRTLTNLLKLVKQEKYRRDSLKSIGTIVSNVSTVA